MAEHSPIEWTEATWNVITGCTVLSPGCAGCYAMKLAGTRLRHHWSREGLTQPSKAGPVWTGEVRFNERWLDQPLHWRRPRMIFVAAHGDLFHHALPDRVLDAVFDMMEAAHWQRTQKSGARQRSAELLADFEQQIGQYYHWDQEPIWQAAYERAQEAIDAANADIRAKCDALGIPRQFQPQIHASWYSGGENAVTSRAPSFGAWQKRASKPSRLRRFPRSSAAAVGAQTEVLAAGLTSQAAIAFVDKLPALENLMPKLDFKVIEKLTGKPAIEAPKGAVVPLRLVEQQSEEE